MRLPEVLVEVPNQLEEDVLNLAGPEVTVAVDCFVRVDEACSDSQLHELVLERQPDHAGRAPLERSIDVEVTLAVVEELGGAVNEPDPFKRVFVDELLSGRSRTSGRGVRRIELRVEPVPRGIGVNESVTELVSAIVLVSEAQKPQNVAVAVAPDDAAAVAMVPRPRIRTRPTGPGVRERRARVLLLEQPSQARPDPDRPRNVLVAAALG